MCKELGWNPAVGDLFENQGQLCRVPFLDLLLIFHSRRVLVTVKARYVYER